MKIHFDIDLTPEEARKVMGLPDVEPLQEAMLEEIEKRMKRALDLMEPDALFKIWLPAGMERMEAMRSAFFGRFAAAARGAAAEPGAPKRSSSASRTKKKKS